MQVTGSSSGFGRSMTELLLKNGNRVVATLRRKEARWSSQLTGVFTKAKEVFGRVDAVFNNAGIGIITKMESLSYEEAHMVFEANSWDASNVTREAIRMLREVNKPIWGILLQDSSTLGLHALGGFSESIAQELDPAWNIKVTIIEPGPFRTRVFADNLQPELAGTKLREGVISSLPNGDAEKAVAAIEKRKRQSLAETMDRYGSWSEDVYFT
ncbi:NAD(P)-binding protein [Suillus placidus]|uniref:NAD(P)-binding protein n=1 Tax=Suillus placidus TaxID=48579 RepID=A0A9P7D4L6_9AGAM|nr:NAD(P)-binding protein [Suillus placidus]